MESTTADQPLTSWAFLDLLRKAVQIYRENFVTFIGLMAIVIIPLTLLGQGLLIFNVYPLTNVSSMSAAETSQAAGTVCMTTVLILLITILQLVLSYGPIVHATAESLMGRKLSIAQAFNERRGRYFGLGIGLVFFHIVLGAFLTLISLFSLMLRCSPVLAALGIVVYIAIAGFTMLPPVLVLEGVPAVSGVSRAWALGKANFWKNFGAMTLVGVITTVIQLAFVALTQGLIFQNLQPLSVTTQFAQTAVNSFISIFTLPLLPIVLTLLYFDARVRFEGLDVALQTLDRSNARTWDIAAPAKRGRLQDKDWRNIAILMVVALVLALLFGAAISAWISSITPMRGLPI